MQVAMQETESAQFFSSKCTKNRLSVKHAKTETVHLLLFVQLQIYILMGRLSHGLHNWIVTGFSGLRKTTGEKRKG